MRPIRMFVFAIVAASPAVAQDAAQQPVSTRILLAGNACTEASNAGGNLDVIGVCAQSAINIQALKDANTLNPHEMNLYHVMLAVAHTTMGSRMGVMDHARSKRACDELEISWANLSKLVPGNSPPDYASDMFDLQQQAVQPVKQCRSEFGTPAGAPRLPPGVE